MLKEDAKRPFARFEMQPKLNRTKSEEAGHQVYDDVAYVIVMQHGSKDEFVKEAVEWLAQKKREAGQGTYPPDWAKYFKTSYDEWLQGNEMPVEGTPLRMWPVVSAGEIKTFAAMMPPIVTVEELSSVTDANLNALGLNGRVMRDKARAWLETAKDQGKVAEEMASLKELNRQQGDAIEQMATRMKELEALIPKKKRTPEPAEA